MNPNPSAARDVPPAGTSRPAPLPRRSRAARRELYRAARRLAKRDGLPVPAWNDFNLNLLHHAPVQRRPFLAFLRALVSGLK
jgi:hypothetical protein